MSRRNTARESRVRGAVRRCLDRIRSIRRGGAAEEPDVKRRAFLRRAGAAGAVATTGLGAAATSGAAAGENCDWSRTDDGHLPWSTDGAYGGWGGHEYWETGSGTDRTPTVFVHGNGGDACNWNAMATHLRNDGWKGDALWAITFPEYTNDHESMLEPLDDFVQHVMAQTGSPEVDVVCHSLGVTGVRYWLQEYDRYGWVRRFVGLAGANHGVCVCPGCYDTTLGEDYDGFMGAGEVCQFIAIQCFSVPGHPLYELNLPTETPGDVDYYTMRGYYDPLFACNPTSPYLEGADNSLRWRNHTGLLEESNAVRSRLS